MLSHLFFLLNRYDSLLGSIGLYVFALTWSSTSLCLGYSALLGQYQKWILFLPSLLRKVLAIETKGINMFWRGSTLDSRIFLAAAIESVMTVILWMLSISIAGMRLVWIAMSSASRGVIFMEWTCNCLMTELSTQTCTAAVATWDFLIPLSAMTAALLWFIWDDLKVRLRLWRYW